MANHVNGQTNKRVTQKDVAERAGVSTSIVSYVINNGPRSVSPQTRRRVLRAVEELGYRPNKHAQMLTSGKERTDAGVREFGIVVSGSASAHRGAAGRGADHCCVRRVQQ